MATILVIDDDIAMRNILFDILSLDGYEVLLSNNGELGLKRFKEHKPDLVITDILMPTMDGLELLELLKAEFPETPVIVVTGTSSLNLIEEAVHQHANRILKKPFEADQLLDSVAELLGEDENKGHETFAHHHYPLASS